MTVVLVPRRRQRYWLHALLLLATIFTTLVVGSHFEYNYLHQRAAWQTKTTAILDSSLSTWSGTIRRVCFWAFPSRRA